jgi:hypothetical protein
LKTDGFGVVAGIQAYPTEGNDVWQMENWIQPAVRVMAAQGIPAVLFCAAYTQTGNWSPRSVARMLIRNTGATNTLGRIVFGLHRRLEDPNVQRWCAQFLAASVPIGQGAARWPRTRPEVVVVPEPKPEPVPESEPKTQVRKPKASDRAARDAQIAIAGAVGAFWLTKFFRKLFGKKD